MAGRGPRLGYLAFVAGFGLVILGALFLAVPTAAGIAFGTLFVLAGALSLLFGFGYQRGRRWAWFMGIATGGIYVIVGVLVVPAFPFPGAASIIYGTLVVSFMDRKEVKGRFGVIPAA